MPSTTHVLRGDAGVSLIRSVVVTNIDNGAGTTIDHLLGRFSVDVQLLSAKFVYTEVAQTVAAGNFKVGSAVGGAQYVTATAYTNAAAVGSATTGTLASGKVTIPANTSIWFRHTGVATTQTGEGFLFLEVVPAAA